MGTWDTKHTPHILLMGLRTVSKDPKGKALVLHGKDGREIPVSSFSMSCRSARPTSLDKKWLFGVVIYSYKDKTDFYINGVHCKAGYVYLQEAHVLGCAPDVHKSDPGVHAVLLDLLFGGTVDTNDFVATGFSVQNGTFVFRSGTFNGKNDNWRNTDIDDVPLIEQLYIKTHVKQWVANKGAHSAKILQI